MTPRWADLLPLAYASSLAEKRYSTQWTVYRGPAGDGLHEIELLLELDPAAIGMGGSLIRQRSRLFCDDAFAPVRYSSDTDGQRFELVFHETEVQATLPDGSRQTIPRDGARFVVDGNLAGLTALLYRQLHERGLLAGETTVRLFLGDGLVAVPFTTAPAADGWHHSSHRTEVLLDANGVLVEARMPSRGVRTWREEPAPPLPEWPERLGREVAPIRYERPADATFRLEDVTIHGPVTPIGATLTIPAGEGPFPAVLFLSGSGTHDRHGIAGEIDMGTHEILDHLAERGFAGLRFDTRGAGTTAMGEDTLDRGLDSDIADARACLAWLRERPEIAGRPLFLIGHSQGSTIALVLAVDADLAGIVLLAPMVRSVHEIVADQLRSHGKLVGLSDEQIEQQIADIHEAVELVRSGRPWKAGDVPDHLLGLLRTPTWLRQFLAYRPPELIATVTCPVLICQGGKDFQVSPERDAEVLVRAAREAGVDCEYVLLPELDHLFKRSKGESTLAEYFDRSRRIDAGLLTVIEQWLRRVSA